MNKGALHLPRTAFGVELPWVLQWPESAQIPNPKSQASSIGEGAGHIVDNNNNLMVSSAGEEE